MNTIIGLILYLLAGLIIVAKYRTEKTALISLSLLALSAFLTGEQVIYLITWSLFGIVISIREFGFSRGILLAGIAIFSIFLIIFNIQPLLGLSFLYVIGLLRFAIGKLRFRGEPKYIIYCRVLFVASFVTFVMFLSVIYVYDVRLLLGSTTLRMISLILITTTVLVFLLIGHRSIGWKKSILGGVFLVAILVLINLSYKEMYHLYLYQIQPQDPEVIISSFINIGLLAILILIIGFLLFRLIPTYTEALVPRELTMVLGEVYKSDRYRFSIRCPSGWKIHTKVKESLPEKLLFYILTLNRSIKFLLKGKIPSYVDETLFEFEDPRGIGSIMLIVGRCDETIEDTIEYAKNYISGPAKTRVISVGSDQAVEVKYDLSRNLRAKKVSIIKYGYEYVFTCAAYKECFGEYEPIFDNCIQSLKFI
jgi:hypothetical protein